MRTSKLDPRHPDARPEPDFNDPKVVKHYEECVELKRILAEDFDVRPEIIKPTMDCRGHVRLTFGEVYELIYDEQGSPPVPTLSPNDEVSRPASKLDVVRSEEDQLHGVEAEMLRKILDEEYDVQPRLCNPTRDRRGVVQLTFNETRMLIFEDEEKDPLD